MTGEIVKGLMIPFLGTTLGSACVFPARRDLNARVRRALEGFASGVMVAASIWSLLIPALAQSTGLGAWAFVPAAAGFWAGILFLLLLDRLVPHLHLDATRAEGPRKGWSRTTMLVLAVANHNIPEGMAVGVVYAGALAGGGVRLAGALALAVGIAIQNFPEGAIISLPLRAEGLSRGKAFFYGAASGAVEPLAALVTLWAARLVTPVMPYFLSFAAGAMIYVVVEELIPEMSSGEHSNLGTVMFALGFTVMMALDVALG